MATNYCGWVALSDLTHESVLEAIAEHDRVGREAFLDKYGFSRARSYLLEYEGRRYDSKAICGAAHGYAVGSPLTPSDFSGGADTVKPRLEALGFRVLRQVSPDWDRQEIILACDLVVGNGWRELRMNDPQVRDLSDLLRRMTIHPPTERGEDFRSPGSVSRKTTDLMTAHPDYGGARTRGSRLDREVVAAFIRDPDGMKAEAEALREIAGHGSTLRRKRRAGVTHGLSAEHIDEAIGEWHRLGRDSFMKRYGGRPADRYVVITPDGVEVDALALILGARELAGLDLTGPWRGDRPNVAEPLTAFGFRVEQADRESSPEVQAAETAVQLAAGREPRGSRGQGFSIDQVAKVAIETHAMDSAQRHYEQSGTVADTASRKSWDLEVDIDGTIWHVEVKGTTGDPVDVLLTPNEVAHAQQYEHVALYVLSNISLVGADGQRDAARGGRVTIYQPWTINPDDLAPLGYKYRLPTVHRSTQ